ncbi:hypothetical protein EXM22_02935 [Oceanispirochaeta crateris]|uniref:Glycosyltransferase RgtA/B/C/D-like domain-containing protein n=1 Tax=Oceanispirochaeta crateris TaxID=2518645 RepID=A0A5C1QIL5_9SPIO|nr:hypothetical protein [Oceanispirochaeta crateris]QEN06989.1 hypothetical protein EXM22_02935 [Oceanispirochaeta crateris]
MRLKHSLNRLDDLIPGKMLFILFWILILLSYVCLNIGFKPELRDNAWSHYWAYDFFKNGIVEDRFIGNGLANLSLTGVTPAFFYGSIMNLIGWQLPRALLISTFLIIAALGLWYRILKDKNWSFKSIALFITIGLLLDAYFEPSHTTKTDAFTFFMLSISFFSFTKKRYLLAGFLALVCVESHPIGITVFFYMLGHFLGNREKILAESKIKPFVYFGIGLIIGLCYYFLLHYKALFQSTYSLDYTLNNNKEMFYFFSYILKYFFPGGLNKHIPEFLILFAGLGLGIICKYYKKDSSLYWILGLVFFSSLINPRPVHTYVIMAFPALLMVLVDTATRLRFQKLVLLYFFLLLLPQFAYLGIKSRSWPNHRQYVQNIQSQLPNDTSLPLLGSSNEWFASLGSFDYHHFTWLDFSPSSKPDKFYFILEDDGRKSGLPDRWESQYSFSLINEFENYGEEFDIFLAEKR